MQPTILTNVTPDNPAYRQEFFGPVALFFIARDEDEAIAIANDSPFGLGGSVYTSNIEHPSRSMSNSNKPALWITRHDSGIALAQAKDGRVWFADDSKGGEVRPL